MHTEMRPGDLVETCPGTVRETSPDVPPRGADPEDFEPRAVESLLDEIDDLGVQKQADPEIRVEAPLWVALRQKGTRIHDDGPVTLALYGIVVQGATSPNAAEAWIAAARQRLDQARAA